MYAVRLLENNNKNSITYFPLKIFFAMTDLLDAYVKVNRLDTSLFVGSSMHRNIHWKRSGFQETEIVLFAEKLGAMHFAKFIQEQNNYVLAVMNMTDCVLVPEEVAPELMDREYERFINGLEETV
jgi:hypothetical protein